MSSGRTFQFCDAAEPHVTTCRRVLLAVLPPWGCRHNPEFTLRILPLVSKYHRVPVLAASQVKMTTGVPLAVPFPCG